MVLMSDHISTGACLIPIKGLYVQFALSTEKFKTIIWVSRRAKPFRATCSVYTSNKLHTQIHHISPALDSCAFLFSVGRRSELRTCCPGALLDFSHQLPNQHTLSRHHSTLGHIH